MKKQNIVLLLILLCMNYVVAQTRDTVIIKMVRHTTKEERKGLFF